MRNVACWGLGEHACRNLIPALMSCAGTLLVGAWTRDSTVRQSECELHGIRAYESEQEMLDDDRVDTIVVATPTGLHIEHGLRVVGSGKHLWSEKSLFLKGHDASRLLSLVGEAELEVKELFMFLYHQQFRELELLLSSKRLGRLFSLTCRFGIPHLDASNIRYDADLGGGALMDAGCYPIAAAHRLLGPEPERVTSFIGSEDNYSVDTYGRALFEYGDGRSAFLEWGFGMSYRNEIRAWCERGSVLVERAFSKPPQLATTISVLDSSGAVEEIALEAENHFESMFDSGCDRTGRVWVEGQTKLLDMVLTGSMRGIL